jgi:Xaa-Pro aminopeptidase
MTSPIPSRLAALRDAMRRHGLSHYLVPTSDPHLSEYPPAWWRRREHLTGFTGSAGTALIGLERAWLWADSRYWLQAESELKDSGIELVKMGASGAPSPTDGMAAEVGAGTLGVDPQVISIEDRRRHEKALEQRGGRLVLLEENLVDGLWTDRPRPSTAPLVPLAERFSGESPARKLERIQKALTERGADALVVTMLDAVAWLFDVRGTDVDFNPVAVAQAIVTKDGATLFVDDAKVDDALRRHLPNTVRLEPYAAFGAALDALAQARSRTWVEPSGSSAWVASRLASGARLVEERSPVTNFKARKNATEIEGARRCHVRDGVAMVRFLAWLEQEWTTRPVTELIAARKLETFRSEGEHFRGLSFETISAFGSHGAVVHYRPTDEEGHRVIDDSSTYLLDSGAQYLDGTTDITRTICLGTPTPEQIDQATRVLKGHVAIARVTFPAGTSGKQIDALARVALWEKGLNFGHGTGHGVGAYLNVHEGPQRIAPKGDDVALEPGMIVSNEPGYYVDGSHGHRVESLVVVVERPDLSAAEPFLGFDTITCCPIDRKLIDRDRLGVEERSFIDGYHSWVVSTLSPLVDAATGAWLERACAPL